MVGSADGPYVPSALTPKTIQVRIVLASTLKVAVGLVAADAPLHVRSISAAIFWAAVIASWAAWLGTLGLSATNVLSIVAPAGAFSCVRRLMIASQSAFSSMPFPGVDFDTVNVPFWTITRASWGRT